MFMTFIDIEQPHLSVFYTKKYYNKKFGTNLKSLKKLEHYYRQYFRRKVEDMSNYEIYPMGEPDKNLFNVKYIYNTDN